ncbi:MAG: hypothetical protein Kow0099_09370 [Candidatus Abyssubacteria bacterium]
MRKYTVAGLAICLIIATAAMAAEKTLDVSGRALNSTPLLGPEGILITAAGDIYAGTHDGKIVSIAADGAVTEFADLNRLPGTREEQISAIGIAMDGAGDIYAATLDFNGGAVLRVTGPGKPDAGEVSMYRHGIGMANFILIDNESSTMYVSNSSMFSGGVFRFDMADTSRVGTAVAPEKELLGEFAYANGLALGPDRQFLYIAETTKGRVSKLNLQTRESTVFAEVGGWADGIAFNPDKTLLFVCDNKGGRIVALDLSGNIVGEARLIGKEGQCAPASLAFRDSDTLAFTDLWRASLWRALIGRPQHHSYVYELSVGELGVGR